MALGGRAIENGGRSYGRGATGFAAVPSDISRGWDRGSVHEWHNHRYGWRDNGWVILDVETGGYEEPGYTTYSTTTTAGGGVAASVQRALDRRGYDAGPADGVIGPQTQNAIAAFQRDRGLNPTGNINPPLLNALGLQ